VEGYLYYGSIKTISIKDGELQIKFHYFVEAVSKLLVKTGSSSIGLCEPSVGSEKILAYSTPLSGAFIKKDDNSMILGTPVSGDILIFFKKEEIDTSKIIDFKKEEN
jgi:hypothetical protein